jgi:small conductance mechanosensitive channel
MPVTTDSLLQASLSYGLNLLTAVLLLVLGIWGSSWVARMAMQRLQRIQGLDATLVPVAGQIIRYALLGFTGVLVLAEFGVQTTSLIAIFGAAGLAIGLALQGTLQNVAAGIMLLVLRPFRAGHYIKAGDAAGTVQQVGLFLTVLRTPQNLIIAVPNSKIFSNTITNYSIMDRRRIDMLVGISYDDDIDNALDNLTYIVAAQPLLMADPAPKLLVKALGESSVDLEIRAWAKHTDFLEARSSLTRAVKYGLDKAGISIPYPHRQIVVTPQDNVAASEGGIHSSAGLRN